MDKDTLTIDIDFSNVNSEANFIEVLCNGFGMANCGEGNWPALRDMLSDLEVHSEILKTRSKIPDEIHFIINSLK